MPHSKYPQDLKPYQVLDILKQGNFRFINNLNHNHDLLEQVNATKEGQWPFAAVLSCMDSRTSAELIFNLGLGDIFSIRVAGNVVTETIVGSLEYAVAAAGSKLIVVLGHTGCGAIKGACDNVELGHLTRLLNRIQPAVHLEKSVAENRNGQNLEFVNRVSEENVKIGVQQIIQESDIISGMVKEGKVGIVPAMYDITTGRVSFFEDFAEIQHDISPVAAAVNINEQ